MISILFPIFCPKRRRREFSAPTIRQDFNAVALAFHSRAGFVELMRLEPNESYIRGQPIDEKNLETVLCSGGDGCAIFLIMVVEKFRRANSTAETIQATTETAMSVDAKYKATATASGGGREGKAALADGTLELQLVVPRELGGTGGDGANPEKLFALGYSACFLGALRVGATQLKVKVPESTTVTATIGMGPRSEGGFGITATLEVFLPSLEQQDAEVLVEKTHGICPYSNAIKASVDVVFHIRT